jgi:hypothetical protein
MGITIFILHGYLLLSAYQNGSYQGTYLSIFFDGKLEQFQISPKSMYSSLLDELKKFDTTFRIAVKQNNIDYIINNDDFLNHTPKEPLKNCRFAQQSFKKSGRKFQYLAIFSSKQPVFLEN